MAFLQWFKEFIMLDQFGKLMWQVAVLGGCHKSVSADVVTATITILVAAIARMTPNCGVRMQVQCLP